MIPTPHSRAVHSTEVWTIWCSSTNTNLCTIGVNRAARSTDRLMFLPEKATDRRTPGGSYVRTNPPLFSIATCGASRSRCTFTSGNMLCGVDPPGGSSHKPCKRALHVIAPTPVLWRRSCSSGYSSNAPVNGNPSIENRMAGPPTSSSTDGQARLEGAITTALPLKPFPASVASSLLDLRSDHREARRLD